MQELSMREMVSWLADKGPIAEAIRDRLLRDADEIAGLKNDLDHEIGVRNG